MSTTLSMVFAVTDIEDSDGLLVYLPSGDPGHVEDDTRDYMAIEMVDRRIRFLWNNGAGKGYLKICLKTTACKECNHFFGTIFLCYQLSSRFPWRQKLNLGADTLTNNVAK